MLFLGQKTFQLLILRYSHHKYFMQIYKNLYIQKNIYTEIYIKYFLGFRLYICHLYLIACHKNLQDFQKNFSLIVKAFTFHLDSLKHFDSHKGELISRF